VRGGALLLIAIACAAGCGRRVVIDPDEVHERNTPGWVVRRPVGAPPPSSAPAPLAPPDAGVVAPPAATRSI
jgi:hypothetical protein